MRNVHPDEGGGGRRRRGVELEDAVLDAGWQVLRDHGYPGFTLEAVARAAGTSRPVLARRWADRHALLEATIARYGRQRRVPTPDTGTVRGDLIAFLRQQNRTHCDLTTLLGVQFGGYHAETGRTVADLRELLVRGNDDAVDAILQAGVERGEIDPDRLLPRVRALPWDLLRHHVLLTSGPMPLTGIDEIVDQVFLPLVRPGR